MFFNKKETNVNNTNQEEIQQQKTRKSRPGTFDGIRDLTKMIFKKRDYKIELREITKEDKKAAIITVIIIIVVGLLLWFLPFTHQFIEDVIFLRI